MEFIVARAFILHQENYFIFGKYSEYNNIVFLIDQLVVDNNLMFTTRSHEKNTAF